MGTRTVTSTYRLQLHGGFTFADAAARIPYLGRLGVSHLYLSPILQAAPGSQHGYDVVDHTRISADLGGMDGFAALATTAHQHDLGIIADVVPNHMALCAPESLNQPLWQVLRDGRDAETADWFDIDWKAGGGRIGLPLLGAPVDDAIAAGDLHRDELDGRPVLRYFDHVWPLSLGSEDIEDTARLLEYQHYRLAWWKTKDTALNYRRFFEVDGLIAVRVELPDVFDATHALLLRLHHDGLIDGFRIDHPDGLADPAGYLQRLSDACEPGTPIWVEKILEHGERLPEGWHCSGTTGYDALAAIQTTLTDPSSSPVLDATWSSCLDDETDYEQTVRAAKRQVVESSLAPEVERLTRRARESRPDLDPTRLRQAVVEVLVAGEVYRAYLRPDEQVGPEARERLQSAFSAAMLSRPDLHAEVEALIPLALIADSDEATEDFGIRLQQTWGPVMAKGIEDTTFYRWHRLDAVAEVGSDPSVPPNAGALHDWSIWTQGHRPGTMTTLSTHDTKRSEDVRARILAIAGDPDTWQHLSDVARAQAQRAHVDLPTGHFVWQTLLGAGDLDDPRLTEYLRKALREAKLHTTWTQVDAEYEAKVIDFAEHARDAGDLHDAIAQALDTHADAVRATVLTAKLLQLTMPGIPDIYQGCELVDLSLVDPDNRRPVDFDRRESLLASIDSAHDTLDAAKLLVTTRALYARRWHPGAFDAQSMYTPLPGQSDHLVGFCRGEAPSTVTRLLGRAAPARFVIVGTRAPARLQRDGGWGAAELTLGGGDWHDLLTGADYHDADVVQCANLLSKLPVALLEKVS